MRILMLNANRRGCGTYHRALWFARMCARHAGHECTVCTVSPSRRWARREFVDEPGVTIVDGASAGYTLMPGYGSNLLDIIWRLRAVRRGGFDVVYQFEYHPNVAWPVRWGRQSGQRVLSDWCDWYAGAANVFRGSRLAHAWDARREERIRLKADRVSVISSVLADRAKSIGVPDNRIHLLREGVDTSYMRPFPADDMRRSLGIPPGVPVVGTLNDGHTFPYLVAACAEARARVPGLTLLLVGRSGDTQQNIVASHGMQDAFVATGWVDDNTLPRALSAADVAAFPLQDTLANRARFPHKIGDYLACGLPLVVTDVGDYPALLKNNDAAVVTPVGPAFSDALASLLLDHDARRHYAETGRSWVARSLAWDVIAPGIVKFVET